MRRRSRAASKPAKGRVHRASGRKPRKALTQRASAADLQEQLDRRTHERDEALAHQTATAEVLRVISSSPGELSSVFEAILEKAVNICDAKFGVLFRWEGDVFRTVALHGVPKALAEERRRNPVLRPNPRTALGRLVETKRTIQVADVGADPGYQADPVRRTGIIGAGGARTLISVPMLKDNELVGAIGIYRQEVRPFTDKQIELVQNFAAQAVIAIENARLLNELRQRTNDLSESLEQQTATSEVLKVISSSPGELEQVFRAMLENAVRICGAKFGNLWLREGDMFRIGATHAMPQSYVDYLHSEKVFHPDPKVGLGRMLRTKEALQEADVAAVPTHGDKARQALIDLAGARTLIGVPMLKDNEVVGVIGIYRQEVRPFTDKQIELVRNFAAQAVIAIENTRLLNELRQRTDDLSEALEQQTATSEVLQTISSSPGRLKPVFESMLENAVRICGATFGNLAMREGGGFRRVAAHNAPQALVEEWKHSSVIPLDKAPLLQRIASTKQVVNIADIATEYPNDMMHTLSGARTIIVVPMLKETELVGAIAIYRQEVRPFTEKQIELLQNFAAQAVIAIENARLLNELRQRTDDLTESLEQQTATSEVLKAISSSPGKLEPVFNSILSNAVHICEADFGNLLLCDGDEFRVALVHSDRPAWSEYRLREPVIRPGEHDPLGRLAATHRLEHVLNLRAERAYLERFPPLVALVDIAGAHTLLLVPMLKEERLMGVIGVYRQEVRAFTDKQIELVQNFASQAVIAIENTRLLNELRQRTDDLSEALEQQTATSEVLKVISSSPGELEPVFNAMLENATRICGAKFGVMFRHNNGTFDQAALFGVPTALAEFIQQRGDSFQPLPGTNLYRMWRTKEVVRIVDDSVEAVVSPPAAFGGARSLVAVPMLKENELIGAIVIYRQEVRPFTDKQVELVQNFAAQAVIAIENTRLLNELRESLQQQTATADVLKVISRSTFDLQTVLNTLLESAARLCRANRAAVRLARDGKFHAVALHGFPPEHVSYMKSHPTTADRSSVAGRVALEGKIIHIPNVAADRELTLLQARGVVNSGTILGVPLLREGVPIGILIISRAEIEPFTDKQIELVITFADQAVIAIENVRLFESVENRTRELAKSLEELRTMQDRLVQTEKLASLGQLTAGIAHEIKNPLNFVNNFSGVSAELIDELQDTLKGAPFDDKARAEITDLTNTLRSNLDKVVQHGKRADAIVKNMLLHSREGSGEHRPVDINALVEESLNLAYHGARAERQGFNIILDRSLDPTAGEVDVFPQEITRVLLNVISNGFYAATRRKAEGNGGDGYEPTLTAGTRNLGDSVEIRIRDNGTGIPPEVKEKMFNPFYTTKPAGEGTGLGLSISHDVIVKQHGGSIEVDTQPGRFTEFRIILPRAAAFLAKSGGEREPSNSRG